MLTGICQGFELLATLVSGDMPKLLQILERDNVNRKVYWTSNNMTQIKTETRLFSNFNETLL
jgi:hypothetical protein